MGKTAQSLDFQGLGGYFLNSWEWVSAGALAPWAFCILWSTMEPGGIALSGEKMGEILALFSEVFPDEYDFLNGAYTGILVGVNAHPQIVRGAAIHKAL